MTSELIEPSGLHMLEGDIRNYARGCGLHELQVWIAEKYPANVRMILQQEAASAPSGRSVRAAQLLARWECFTHFA